MRKVTVKKFSELDIQIEIVAFLRRANIVFAADMSGLRTRATALAKRAGLTAGEPDLRIYLPDEKLLLIELKGPGGTPSDAQIDRHELLRSLGFKVHVVKVDTPLEGVQAVKQLILSCITACDHQPITV